MASYMASCSRLGPRRRCAARPCAGLLTHSGCGVSLKVCHEAWSKIIVVDVMYGIMSARRTHRASFALDARTNNAISAANQALTPAVNVRLDTLIVVW